MVELAFGIAAGVAAVVLILRPGIIDRLVDENRAAMHPGGRPWLWIKEQDDDDYEVSKRVLRVAFPVLSGLIAMVGVGGAVGWWN